MKAKLYTYKNKTLTIKGWSRKLNIDYETLLSRLRSGWSIKKTFSTKICIVKKSPRRMKPQQIEEIKKLYLNGYGLSEIGRMFGKHHATIFYNVRNIRHLPRKIRNNIPINKNLSEIQKPSNREKQMEQYRKYKAPRPVKTYKQYLEDEENRKLARLQNGTKNNK